ncbi:MAG: GIY-YIG nuclease family protein [Patescibacteria group bacterium]
MYLLYILLCSDHSLYIGITTDVERRFQNHKNGKGGAYTRSHKPLKIIYQESHPDRSSALKREFEIKSWSRQKKIEILKLLDV